MHKVCMRDAYTDLLFLQNLLAVIAPTVSQKEYSVFKQSKLDASSSFTKATGRSLRAANLAKNLRKFC